jgi:hypothetical protein
VCVSAGGVVACCDWNVQSAVVYVNSRGREMAVRQPLGCTPAQVQRLIDFERVATGFCRARCGSCSRDSDVFRGRRPALRTITPGCAEFDHSRLCPRHRIGYMLCPSPARLAGKSRFVSYWLIPVRNAPAYQMDICSPWRTGLEKVVWPRSFPYRT